MLKLLQARLHQARHSAVVFGWFSTAVRMGSNLILLPWIVTALSTEEQALWWMFVALSGFGSLADFGFGQSITRIYSFLWAGAEDFDTEGLRKAPDGAPPNLVRVRELRSTVAYLYWRLSLLAIVLLGIGGTIALWKSVTTSVSPGLSWGLWAVYLIATAYSLGTSHWLFACQGIGLVREIQAAFLWSGLAYLAMAGLLLHWGLGLGALVVASFGRGILIQYFARRAYLAAVPEGEGGGRGVNFSMLARIWPNAKKFGILALGATLVAFSGVLICGHFLDPKTTASYGLTAQIGRFLMTFAGLWLSVKWPEITMLRTQGKLTEMSQLFAGRLCLTVGTFAAGALVLLAFGNSLLEWKGSQSQLLDGPISGIYWAYLMAQLVYVQFGSLAYTENVIPFFRMSLVTGIGVAAVSALLTWQLGLWGLVVAPFLVEWACSGWYIIWRGFRSQSLSLAQFVKSAISEPLRALRST